MDIWYDCRLTLDDGESLPPPRPPKAGSKLEELYQNISASPRLPRQPSPVSINTSPQPNRWHSDIHLQSESEPTSPNNLRVRSPSPLPRTSRSRTPSPSSQKRESQSNSSPFASPPATARTKKYSVDSLYHNNVLPDVTLTIAQGVTQGRYVKRC